MPSPTEENYLKAIYKLKEEKVSQEYINTNAIAEAMCTKAASVTVMIKRLSDKKFVAYQRYKGAKLTNQGEILAKRLIRKHRLWEVFLLEKLHFKWDEVHEIAEQLEHINSQELTDRLDAFLDYPKFDPHGDPIPDKDGNIEQQISIGLSKLTIKTKGIIVGVKEHEPAFLRYLEDQKLILGTQVIILKHHEYDNSFEVAINEERTVTISDKVSKNILVQPLV